jgi:hypothetical protein
MHRLLFGVIVGSAVAMGPGLARAQVVVGGISPPYGISRVYAAPGYYGMSYGTASFGWPRTYSSFASPYGLGYGYGYAPYGLAPGRFGMELWRPGFVVPGYAYGSTFYRTFPVPYVAGAVAPSPPVGVYAPGFGPSTYDYGY